MTAAPQASAPDPIAQAVDLFRQECACSQAILAAFGVPLGLDRMQALRLAAGFALGMHMGETCGAAVGALMVLGLKYAGDNCQTHAGREEVYAAVEQFVAGFKQRNGSLLCRDLLGCDVRTPEGLQAAKQQDLFQTRCPKIVQGAAEILDTLLRHAPADHS
jgi:C_GCAxxG_C_C family probable redox protein